MNYPAPSSRSKSGPSLNGQWKIYPSFMGYVMNLSPYKTKDEAIASLWKYGAKDFFYIALKEEFGDDAKTIEEVVNDIIKEDKLYGKIDKMNTIQQMITWATFAKKSWSRNNNLENIEARLNKIVTNITPEMLKRIMSIIRMKTYTMSGTVGERNALIRCDANYKESTIDWWSPQILPRKYILQDKISDTNEPSESFTGVISCEVDGYMRKGKVVQSLIDQYVSKLNENSNKMKKDSQKGTDLKSYEPLIKESKKHPIIGIVEHKQRQSAYELPTIDQKMTEAVQMQIYMFMVGEKAKHALWVQTNKFMKKDEDEPKQKVDLFKRDDERFPSIAEIKEAMIQTVRDLNHLYVNKNYRIKLLRTVVWKYELPKFLSSMEGSNKRFKTLMDELNNIKIKF